MNQRSSSAVNQTIKDLAKASRISLRILAELALIALIVGIAVLIWLPKIVSGE